jgi:hypothetical protein
MTDKWELCWLDGNSNVWFASPGVAVKHMTKKEFFGTKGMSESYWYDIYPILLDDGWEPFVTGGLTFYFRRKVAF